jgi:hypothetical protein
LEVAVKTIARTSLIAGVLALATAGFAVASPAHAGARTGTASAADEKPLGLVTQATLAQLGDAKAAIGTTVYPGDTLATDQGGMLRLKVGGSQIYLLASSSATLNQNSSAISATVKTGTVGIATTSSDPVSLEIPEGTLRPAAGSAAYGQVTIVAPNEVIISAYSGDLVLDNDGEMHTIPAGKSVRVTMDLVRDSADATEPQEAAGAQTGTGHHQGMRAARHNHLVFETLVLGGAAIGGYFLYQHFTISPSSPNN